VLFAGKLVPFKRPLDLVAAAALLRRSSVPVHVMIAGAGALEGEIARKATQAGIPLSMLGFCNQSEMPAVYSAADVLVLPSDGRETWGLVANEALACGRPVILSDACGAAADLVLDGAVGAAFAVGNVPELAAAIRGILDRPPAPEAIAARSRAFSVAAAADGISSATAYCSAALQGEAGQR
jgi:glycosyltransferase involved in cell wall biosynthesis